MDRIHFERGHPILGSARELARAPDRFLADLALRHGGLARFRILHRNVLVIADPELAHEALVTKWQHFVRGRQSLNLGLVARGLLSMSGPEWLEQRRLSQTAFNREILKSVDVASATATRALFAKWDTERQRDGTVALGSGMLGLSMSVIARMLLSSEIPQATAENIGKTLQACLELIARRNTAPWAPPIWLPTPGNRKLLAVRKELTDFITATIQQRPERAGADSDLHATLSSARDPRTGRGFSAEQLVEETKTLFFAGYETVATGLTWTLYLLGRTPEVADKIVAEADAVLKGRTPGLDDLASLPYARATLMEALRLYPPAYALPRLAGQDAMLGDHRIARGTGVIISISGLHQAATWGEDRGHFRPDRFLAPGWPRRAYMPFGAGRHLCIGADFANVEAAITLVMIMQRYRLGRPNSVGTTARITLSPDAEIKLPLELR